jgi:hypothetical protein
MPFPHVSLANITTSSGVSSTSFFYSHAIRHCNSTCEESRDTEQEETKAI